MLKKADYLIKINFKLKITNNFKQFFRKKSKIIFIIKYTYL